MAKRFLLIGGAGFIGYHLAKRLARRGEVTVVDAGRNYAQLGTEKWDAINEAFKQRCWRLKQLGCELVTADASTSELSAVRADSDTCVVHLAAMPIVNVAETRPELAYRDIRLSAYRAAKHAANRSAERFVFISSSMVYGDWDVLDDWPVPKRECDVTAPKNHYGRLKLEAEHDVRTIAPNNHVIVRPSAVYGLLDANGRVVEKWVRAAMAGETLKLNKRTGQSDFTYVEDLAAGLELACTHPKALGETFNITCGEGRTLHELVDAIRDEAGRVDVEEVDVVSAHPRRGALDITKARELLGYNPQWHIFDGVADYVEWFK